MAGGAVLVAGIRQIVSGRLDENAFPLPAEITHAVVALETHGKDHRTFQQARVHRAVRVMACLASVRANRRMLEDKRATFVGMAF